jgi:hypothetical protein
LFDFGAQPIVQDALVDVEEREGFLPDAWRGMTYGTIDDPRAEVIEGSHQVGAGRLNARIRAASGRRLSELVDGARTVVDLDWQQGVLVDQPGWCLVLDKERSIASAHLHGRGARPETGPIG